MKRSFYLLTILLGTLLVNQAISQNYGIQLDGFDDKIGVPDYQLLNPTSALSLEVWIKADAWESSIWAGTLIGKQNTGPDRGYCITVGENGRAEFTVSIDEHWVAVNTSQIMGLGTWYHIAGVFDGSTSKIYINGVLQNEIDIDGDHRNASGTSLYFGDNPTWTGRNFEGTVDEIRIWRIARTAEEIADNFTTTLVGDEAGLVGYWNMNEGEGSTVSDIGPYDNHGTMLNMDTTVVWVDGFDPPGNDVGVIGVISPYSIGPAFTSEELVKLRIKNFSTDEISGFSVNYKIGDGELVTEMLNQTIPAFDTYDFTFENSVDLAGNESVIVTAYTALDGDSNNNNDTIVQLIEPTDNYMVFDGVQHNFSSAGQTQERTLYINENLDDYSQILLNVDLECPTGGCDPWDQPAHVRMRVDDVVYEIARYITPYGVACGNWTFDITDFKSLLKGSVDFISYIQVWGASGWLVDAELVLVPGTPEYKHSKVDVLWTEDYWVYGDPDISYDLPEQTILIEDDAQEVKIRLTNTGHGQGNTDNAAEFKDATHHIWVSGVQTFEQHLWKDDCDENDCSPQNGTYLYSRAGWCPGQDVQPWIFNLEGYFIAGENITLDYVLEEYTNLLNTGYDNAGHTEPYFRIHSFLITSWNDTVISVNENSNLNQDILNIYPNPVSQQLSFELTKDLESLVEVEIYDINGKRVYYNEAERIFTNEQITIDVSSFKSGLYNLRIIAHDKKYNRKFIIQK